MTRRVFLGFVAVLFGALVFSATPARALDEPAAVAFIDEVVHEAFKALSPKELSPDQRRQIIRGLVERYSDVAQVAEGLIGRFWARATPEDQTKFQSIFIDYMLSGLAGDMLTDVRSEPHIKIRGAQRKGDRILVQSVSQDPGEDPLSVDWVVGTARDGRAAVVLDVMVEGVSPLKVMKEEFTSFLYGNSGRLDALIVVLQKKIDAKLAAK
jgi:phospholipid transport system substrate-binding protein